MPRRCSASCSTGWAGATTGRSGAANSSSATIEPSAGSPTSSRSRCRAARRRSASRGATRTRISSPRSAGSASSPSTAGRELAAYLADKPSRPSTRMIARGVNAPLASSCGRLFDAVAAAAGLCRDRARYEGEAAMMLEAAAGGTVADDDVGLSICAVGRRRAGPGAAMAGAARRPGRHDTHRRRSPRASIPGLAIAIARMVEALRCRAAASPCPAACSRTACCWSRSCGRLASLGCRVLTHRAVPANDGGLALGQAAIAAARLIGERRVNAMCLGIPGTDRRHHRRGRGARDGRGWRRAAPDQHQLHPG